MEYIQITESNRYVVLELFSKSTDKDEVIIKERTGKRIVCPYTKQNISIKNFSILPETATFVNNKSYSFAEHIVFGRKKKSAKYKKMEALK